MMFAKRRQNTAKKKLAEAELKKEQPYKPAPVEVIPEPEVKKKVK